MKVNTDGVLIAAWFSFNNYIDKIKESPKPFKVLDVGSGTGVISLIAAKRLNLYSQNFLITGIDIDLDSYNETLYNFNSSPWSTLLEARHLSLQNLSQEPKEQLSYDLIISNPPFFTNSLKAPSQRRTLARHNDQLTLKELIGSAHTLLKEGALMALVLPALEGERLISYVMENGLFSVERVCKVKTLAHKEPKRYLIELKKRVKAEPQQMVEFETLVMQESGGALYTKEYIELVKEYYIKDFLSTK